VGSDRYENPELDRRELGMEHSKLGKVTVLIGLGLVSGTAFAGHSVAIPEPSALSLLGLSMAVLIVAKVRSSRNKK